MARRGYSETAALTYLAADVTAGATSFTAQDASTWAGIATNGPFIVTLDRGRAGEERLLCTAINTTTGVISGATRGYHGTTAVAHAAAVCTVEHTSAAIDFDEANAHINDTTRNDHTQYARLAAANTFALGQGINVAPGSYQLYVNGVLGSATPTAKFASQGDATDDGAYQAQFNHNAFLANAWLAGAMSDGRFEFALDTGSGPVAKVALSAAGDLSVARNVNLGNATATGTNVLNMKAVSVVPSTTAGQGGLYVGSGGDLHFKGASGTDTVVAPA